MKDPNFIVCPLCGRESKLVEVDGAHIWSCPACPFIGFEFWGAPDLDALVSYVNRPLFSLDA